MSNDVGHVRVRIPLVMARVVDPESQELDSFVVDSYVVAGAVEVLNHEVEEAWIPLLAIELEHGEFFPGGEVEEALIKHFLPNGHERDGEAAEVEEPDGKEVGHIIGRIPVVVDYETGDWESGVHGHHTISGDFEVESAVTPPHVLALLEERVAYSDFYPDVITALSNVFQTEKHPPEDQAVSTPFELLGL